jgi:hypothetical protein
MAQGSGFRHRARSVRALIRTSRFSHRSRRENRAPTGQQHIASRRSLDSAASLGMTKKRKRKAEEVNSLKVPHQVVRGLATHLSHREREFGLGQLRGADFGLILFEPVV